MAVVRAASCQGILTHQGAWHADSCLRHDNKDGCKSGDLEGGGVIGGGGVSRHSNLEDCTSS